MYQRVLRELPTQSMVILANLSGALVTVVAFCLPLEYQSLSPIALLTQMVRILLVNKLCSCGVFDNGHILATILNRGCGFVSHTVR